MLTTKMVLKHELVKALLPSVLSIILGRLIYFLSPAFQKFYLALAQKFYSLMGSEGELLLILLLLALNVSTATYILRDRDKRRHYYFDKYLGIYFHKKTKEPFCSNCLINRIESPLKEHKYGWTCQRKDCRMEFFNPNRQLPPTIILG